MRYTVEPGLYALNNPDAGSPVLVTANYKMSFDHLRRCLPGLDAWILVLDTKGINVWCAAGKGTFGTSELVDRIAQSGLSRVVTHREVILPQLSGPGVAAYEVKKLSGFKALFGPIRAEDLPAFLAAGNKATPRMRRKTFPARERITLIPMELMAALKYAVPVGLAMMVAVAWGGPGRFWADAVAYGLFAFAALMGAVLAGAVLTPLLLPWLPGRAFSFKGSTAGFITALVLTGILVALRSDPGWPLGLEVSAWMLMVPAVAAFLAMNFTGASTYTSLSGVKKEMRRAVPLQIGAAMIGLGLWFSSWLTA